MKTDNRRAAVWLYDGDHLRHPFIRLAAETLVDAGFSVTVIDWATERDSLRYEHLALRPTPLRLGPIHVRGSGAARLMAREVREATARRPSAVLATMPMALMAGWRAARRTDARLVYYPFELYGEQHYKPPYLLRRFELCALRRGIDALITQNEERARVYVEERGARVAPTVVHNYKLVRRVQSSGRLRALLALSPESRIVVYEGQLQKGRALDRLIACLQYLPEDVKLVCMGQRFPWWEEMIEPLLGEPSMKRRVLVAPEVPEDEVAGLAADADVGVIIYDDEVRNNRLCEPGKLSDYLSAGIPVVAPSFPTIQPVIESHRIGATFDTLDPKSIAGAIESVLSVPRETWCEALEEAGEKLTWKTQVDAFIGAVSG